MEIINQVEDEIINIWFKKYEEIYFKPNRTSKPDLNLLDIGNIIKKDSRLIFLTDLNFLEEYTILDRSILSYLILRSFYKHGDFEPEDKKRIEVLLFRSLLYCFRTQLMRLIITYMLHEKENKIPKIMIDFIHHDAPIDTYIKILINLTINIIHCIDIDKYHNIKTPKKYIYILKNILYPKDSRIDPKLSFDEKIDLLDETSHLFFHVFRFNKTLRITEIELKNRELIEKFYPVFRIYDKGHNTTFNYKKRAYDSNYFLNFWMEHIDYNEVNKWQNYSLDSEHKVICNDI